MIEYGTGKIIFKIPPFCQLNEEYWECEYSDICLFIILIKKVAISKWFFLFYSMPCSIIYNLVCNYGWHREIIYKQTKKLGTMSIGIVIFITEKRVGP